MLRRVRHLLSGLIAVAAAIGCGGGGGGGGDGSLYPLWVQTDVAIVDLDGDGRADVLTTAMLSTSATQRSGHLTVYRQTTAGNFTAEDHVVGGYPWSLAIGDVDGDGAPDIVLVDAVSTDPSQPHRIWLLRQDRTQRGRLLAPQVLLESPFAYAAVIADLNGDGAPDIAVDDNALTRGGNGITVLHQNAAARGSFAAPAIVSLTGKVGGIATGDLDQDGHADLAVNFTTGPIGPPTPTALALLLQPDGALQVAATLAPANGRNTARVAIRDIDGNGLPDALRYQTPCCGNPPAYLTAVLQGPAGQFGAVDTPLAGIDGINDAAFADFNGDGRVDAAVAGFFPVGSPSRVAARVNIFLQGAGGTFARSASTDVQGAPSRIAAGDVDGDGRPDLVLLGEDNAAWLMRNRADQPGTFSAPQRLP